MEIITLLYGLAIFCIFLGIVNIFRGKDKIVSYVSFIFSVLIWLITLIPTTATVPNSSNPPTTTSTQTQIPRLTPTTKPTPTPITTPTPLQTQTPTPQPTQIPILSPQPTFSSAPTSIPTPSPEPTPPPAIYSISIICINYSNVSVIPSKWLALPEESVEVEIFANDGYELVDAYFMTENGQYISYGNNNNIWFFIMPSENVVLYVNILPLIEPIPTLSLYEMVEVLWVDFIWNGTSEWNGFIYYFYEFTVILNINIDELSSFTVYWWDSYDKEYYWHSENNMQNYSDILTRFTSFNEPYFECRYLFVSGEENFELIITMDALNGIGTWYNQQGSLLFQQ